MRIAIIYPSFGVISKVNQPNIKAVADNYGVYPNMSLAYVAGAAQKAGHNIIFLDAMASNYSLSDMVLILRKFKPEILMFTLTTYLFHETIGMIRYFRDRFHSTVIVGGRHVSLYPHETIERDEIDIGIIGEAEETVVELLSAMQAKKSIKNVRGIIYKSGSPKKIIITPPRQNITDLDAIPFPARNLLPMDKYYSFISKQKNYAILLTSRGCPFKCIFCEQRTGDVRYRSAKNVADEIEECVRKYSVKEIEFFDPLFTLNKKRVIGICREIIKRELKISWSCRSRVDTIDEEILAKMKNAGCYRINLGIESGNDSILKAIGKFTNTIQIKKAISLTKKSGILAFGYFMVGNPGETRDSIKETISLARELPLDYAQFSRFSILPGTLIYDSYKKKEKRDYWKQYIKDSRFEKSLTTTGTNLSDREINNWIRKAYLSFYFRPLFILRQVIKIRTLSELKRYFSAAFSMIIEPI